MADAEPVLARRRLARVWNEDPGRFRPPRPAPLPRYLGARSLQDSGGLSCCDPAFQARYPRRPIFDSGSRPAELFLSLAGGVYDPAAYKIGLAVCCLLVPLFVIVACWGAGFGPAATCLATGASLLVWWSSPGRRALEAGDIDLLLAALAILAHGGLLIRFDQQPGLLTWQGMLLTGCIGWFAHPMLFLDRAAFVAGLLCSIGPRHALTTWHLTLVLSEIGALGLNKVSGHRLGATLVAAHQR